MTFPLSPVSLFTAMHMFTFLLDDVGIPLNYRHMEGFGVHTFTLLTRDGKVRKWRERAGGREQSTVRPRVRVRRHRRHGDMPQVSHEQHSCNPVKKSVRRRAPLKTRFRPLPGAAVATAAHSRLFFPFSLSTHARILLSLP